MGLKFVISNFGRYFTDFVLVSQNITRINTTRNRSIYLELKLLSSRSIIVIVITQPQKLLLYFSPQLTQLLLFSSIFKDIFQLKCEFTFMLQMQLCVNGGI